MRIGIGYDIHATGPGDFVVLGGVSIPAPFSLVGHSDGDALLHAITDAILGALGEPDIGTFFPPTQEINRNRNSRDFLAFAVQKCKEQGYAISNIDTNIICEKPKISGYREEIRSQIASVCKIEPHQVNLKGRTNEKLDAIGNQKAIATQAVVLLKKNK